MHVMESLNRNYDAKTAFQWCWTNRRYPSILLACHVCLSSFYQRCRSACTPGFHPSTVFSKIASGWSLALTSWNCPHHLGEKGCLLFTAGFDCRRSKPLHLWVKVNAVASKVRNDVAEDKCVLRVFPLAYTWYCITCDVCNDVVC